MPNELVGHCPTKIQPKRTAEVMQYQPSRSVGRTKAGSFPLMRRVGVVTVHKAGVEICYNEMVCDWPSPYGNQ